MRTLDTWVQLLGNERPERPGFRGQPDPGGVQGQWFESPGSTTPPPPPGRGSGVNQALVRYRANGLEVQAAIPPTPPRGPGPTRPWWGTGPMVGKSRQQYPLPGSTGQLGSGDTWAMVRNPESNILCAR